MSFPAYEFYQDSGVDWLGEVPSHWGVPPCRAIVNERTDRNDDGECEDYLSLMANVGVIPYADKGDIGNKKPEDLTKCKMVHEGDFVINSMNYYIGSYGVSPYNGVCSPVYIVLTPRDDVVDSRFAFRIFEMGGFQEYAQSFGNGILEHRRSINWDILKTIPVPVPPPDEQMAISSFLDVETSKIDGLVSEQRRMIELLKEKRQAVISHAVTKGLNPDVPMKPSGIEWLGDVPRHWVEYPLKALFSLKHGYAFDGSGFSSDGEKILMTPGNFCERGGFRPKSPEKYYVGDDFPEEFILDAGQLLVAMTEQAPGLLGSALFVPDRGEYLHNQRVGLVQKLKPDLVHQRFLFHLFNSTRYRSEVSVTSTGAKVKHTSPQKMLTVKVYLPPLTEQAEIACGVDDKLATIDQLQSEAERAIELLEERRTALISAAVTGKIDVREFALEGVG